MRTSSRRPTGQAGAGRADEPDAGRGRRADASLFSPRSDRVVPRRVLAMAAGVSVLIASASAGAVEPARFELEYAAEAACPDSRAFEQLVQTQLAEFGSVSSTSQARVIVGFQRSAAGIVGRFELVRRDGSRSSRELESASCDEAATALAFVLALALSGRASSDVGSGSSQPPVEAQFVPAPARPTPERQHPARADERQLSSSWRWLFGLGVQLGVRSGVGPRLTPVEAAVLGMRAQHRHARELSVRIAFLRGQPITHSDAAGDSAFKWLAGRVEGCFWSVALTEGLSATPCLSTHIGQLAVEGEPEPLPGATGRRAAGVWLEAGGGVRLELRLVKGLALELQGEAVVPLTRYRFAFDRPDTEVYRVPRLAAYASFGLVAHFP